MVVSHVGELLWLALLACMWPVILRFFACVCLVGMQNVNLLNAARTMWPQVPTVVQSLLQQVSFDTLTSQMPAGRVNKLLWTNACMTNACMLCRTVLASHPPCAIIHSVYSGNLKAYV